jgi:L-2-hydroxyglutarate oxidase LhgO
MPETTDVTIIGAGVVGLAIATEVSGNNREVYLLEKNSRFGQEQSSRTSEVIHAGIFNPADTLKTKFCQEGNRLLYEICENHKIAHRRCGKLFVAANNDEVESLEALYRAGLENGARLKMLSRKEMQELEPHLEGTAAFLSPDTGVLDSHALMRYYRIKARENGAHIVYRSKVTGIEKVPEGYRVRVDDHARDTTFTTRVLINSAGLYCDRIAELAGIDIDRESYRQNWVKGEFYSVGNRKNRMVNSLIYPVPESVGPGIHVCLDVHRKLSLGPLFYPVDKPDFKTDESNREAFVNSSIMKVLPFIEPDDLAPEMAGIMVVFKEGVEKERDFIIRDERGNGLPGLINLIGIGSPGMTAAPAIARHVSRLVEEAG